MRERQRAAERRSRPGLGLSSRRLRFVAFAAGIAALAAIPFAWGAVGNVTVPVTTTSLNVITATHEQGSFPATCANGNLVVGGGSYDRNASSAATVPTNGLVLFGTMPSDGSGNAVGNGGLSPASWTTVVGYSGASEAGDENETFAMCKPSGGGAGPASTIVETATSVGPNATQEVSPPVVTTASCPGGDVLLGGGAVEETPGQVNDGNTPGNNSGNLKPLASYPSSATGVMAANGSSNPTSWSAYGSAGVTASTDTIVAFAVCSTDPNYQPVITVVRHDDPGPLGQLGTSVTSDTVSCSTGQLFGGGYEVDESVNGTSGLQPQQGYHMRGDYPSDGGGNEVPNGSTNPADWTAVLQAGGVSLGSNNLMTMHTFAMCASPVGAALSLTDSAAPSPALVNSPLTYTLTATNGGPQAATGTVLTDALPAGEAFVSANASQGSCNQAAGTVTCTLGTVASGAQATATIAVTPTVTGPLSDQAAVTANQTNPNPSAAMASAPVQVTNASSTADLALASSPSPSPATAGQPVTYTLTASNAGPGSATGVTVSDPLPAGTSFVSASPSQGLCGQASGTVTCILGSVSSGSSATVALTITPRSAGAVTNTATVTGNQADANVANNTVTTTTPVKPAADLALAQTGAPSPVVVGFPVTYTVTATNNGPSPSTGTTITDTLPPGATFVSATPSQGTCSLVAGTVTCSAGLVAAGGSATLSVVVTPLVTGSGSLTNAATVGGSQVNPVPSNNNSSLAVPVSSEGSATDLGVTIAAPGTTTLGSPLAYTITAADNGTAAAAGVVVTDTLPASTVFGSATPSQGTCSQIGATVTCQLGAIAAGSNASVTLIATPAGSLGQITDTSSVSGPQPDPLPANNTASAATTVTAPTGAYTVFVANHGSSSLIPISTSTNTAGSAVTGVSNADIVAIAPNGGKAYVTNAQPQPGQVLTVTLPTGPSATTVLGPQTGPIGIAIAPNGQTAYAANNTASTITPLTLGATTTTGTAFSSAGTAPLGIAITPNGQTLYVVNTGSGTVVPISTATNTARTPISVGSGAQWIAIAPNGLTAYLTNNVANTVIPINLTTGALGTPISVGSTPEGIAISPDGKTAWVADSGSNAVTPIALPSGIPGTAIPVGTSPQFVAVTPDGAEVYVSNSGSNNVTPIVAATGVAATPITVGTNPQGLAVRPVAGSFPEADLAVTDTPSAPSVVAGTNLTYTLTATDNGPDASTGTMLTDTLPAGTTFVSASSSQGTCSQASGTVTCGIAGLALGGSATVSVVVTTTGAAVPSITNSVSVTGNETDPAASNSTNVTAATAVTVSADVGIALAAFPAAVGGNITYTVTATDNGPSPATGVTVVDALPAGLAYVSATPSAGTCQQSSGTVTCQLGALAAQGSATITLVATTSALGNVTNTATVTANEPDPVGANNSATITTPVVVAGDTDLTVTESPIAPVQVGASFTYTITATDGGPAAATGVTLTDALPTSAALVSATPSQGSCSGTATVTCTIGSLSAGSSATVTVVATALVQGTITNQASITGSQTDPAQANNTASGATSASYVGYAGSTNGAATTAPIFNTSTNALTGQAVATGSVPAYFAVSPNGQTLYVGSFNANTVLEVSTATNTVIKTINVGAQPRGMALSPNGQILYVTPGSGSGSAIGALPVTVTPTAACPSPPCVGSIVLLTSPTGGVAITPDGQTAYVASSGLNTVTPINIATDKAGLPIPINDGTALGAGPTAIAITPNGQTAYVADNGGGITPINLATNTPGPTIDPAPGGVQTPAFSFAGIAIAPNGQTAYALNQVGQVVPINLTTNTVGTPIQAVNASNFLVGITITPDGQTAYLSNVTGGAVVPLSLATNTGGTPIPVPGAAAAAVVGAGPNTADLSLSSSGSAGTLSAGSPLTYTLTASNAGPNVSTGTTLTDTLPANATFVSATPSQGNCSVSAGTLTCDLEGLAVGGTATVSVVIVPTAVAAGGTITNSSSLSGNENDLNQATNASSVTTNVTNGAAGSASILLTASATPSVLVGGSLSVTLTATNNGPATATDLAVADTIPANAVLASATPSQGSCPSQPTASVLTCPLGSLAAGASATVTVVLTPITSGKVTDQATATADQANPSPAGATASTTSTASYTLWVTSNSSNFLTSVDTVSEATNTTAASVGNPSYAIAITPNGRTAYVVENGKGQVLPIDLTTNPPTPGTAILCCSGPRAIAIAPNGKTAYVADFSGNVVEPINLSTNTFGPAIPVGAGPDGIAITPDGTTAYVASATAATVTPITLVITSGCASPPCAGTPISVGTGAFPMGVAVSPDGLTVYVADNGSNAVTPISVATNTAGSPIPGGPRPVTVAITPDGKTLYVMDSNNAVTPINLVTGTSGASFATTISTPEWGSITPDGKTLFVDAGSNFFITPINVSNNAIGTQVLSGTAPMGMAITGAATSSASDTWAGLALSGSASSSNAAVGGNLTYTLTASNSGPNVSSGTVVTDTLPANVNFVSATPSQGSCSLASGVMTCSLSGLPVGGSATVAIVVSPTAAALGTSLTDTASVSGNENQVPGNSTSATIVTASVTNGADLSVTPSGGTTAVTGGQATFTLAVTDAGTADATNVVLGATIDSGLPLVSATPGHGSCTPSGQTISCALGTIASGSQTTVTVVASAPTTGTFTSSTSVASDQADPNPANNAATIKTVVGPSGSADLSLTLSAAPPPVAIGSNVTYTFTARDNGPADATGVMVTDTLPFGAQIVSATPSQGSCAAPSGGAVSCMLGALSAGGAGATIAIVVDAPTPSFTNSASVSGGQSDAINGNNTVTTASTAVYMGLVTSSSTVLPFNSTTSIPGGSIAAVTSASSLAISPDGKTAYATGSASTVTAINLATNATSTFSPGAIATEIAIAPNGRSAYALNQGANSVTPLNLTTATPTPGTAVLVGQQPLAMAYTPDGQTLYVANSLSNTVTPINVATNTAGAPIQVGQFPDALAVTPDGKTLLVADRNSPDITPVNVATGTPGTPISLFATGLSPVALAISPNGSTAYIESLSSASVTPLNLATGVLGTAIPVGTQNPNNQGPQTLALTPDGSTLYALNSNGGQMVAISTATSTPGSIYLVSSPKAIAINPGGANAADLSLIGAAASSVAGGSHLTYQLTASNAGPDASTGTTITDPLPAGTSFVSATSSQGSCSFASGTVTCNMSGLAIGGSATVSIVVVPSNTAAGSLADTATISGNEFDSNAQNNPATMSTNVSSGGTGTANLTLTDTGAPSSVAVGKNLTYTLTATDAGAGDATNVSVADTLPSGASFVSATPSQGSCGAPSGGIVTCSLGSITAGSSATVAVVVTPTVSGTVTSTATATATQSNPNPGDASATATNTAFYTAYVAAQTTKTVLPINTVTGGSTAPITLTQTTPIADAVTPDQTIAWVVTQGSNAIVPVTLATGAVGTPVTVGSAPVAIAITPDGHTAYVANSSGNSVSVLSLSGATATVTATIPVQTSPQGVAVTPDGKTVYVSNSSSASVSVIGTATNTVTATITLPASSVPRGIAFSPSGRDAYVAVGTLNTIDEIDVPTGVLIASIGLPSGAAPFAVAITPDGTTAYVANSGTANVSPINLSTNTAGSPIAISGEGGTSLPEGIAITPDGKTVLVTNPGNAANIVTPITVATNAVGTPVGGGTGVRGIAIAAGAPNLADLSLAGSGPATIAAGGALTYTLTASNAGPNVSTGTTVTDTLPPNVSFVSATPGQGSCSLSSGVITCALGGLAVGGHATVTVLVNPAVAAVGGSLTDTASISGIESDPNNANNSTSILTSSVTAAADLSLTESSSSPLAAGTNATYVLTATNIGPSTATGVTLTDHLAGLGYVSATPSQGSCQQSSGTITCDLLTLSSGASATITIVASTSATGSFTNTAAISSSLGDPNAANNQASFTTAVDAVGSADLSITAAAAPTPVTAGANLTYTVIATDNGPAAATGVTVSDALPPTAGFVSASSTQGSCVTASGTVGCVVGALGVGASATVTIVVTTPAGEAVLNDSANVAAVQTDPAPANNQAAVSTMPLTQYTAYVTSGLAGSVTPINAVTDAAGTPITGFNNPQGIAITPNGATALVANFGGNSVTPVSLTASASCASPPCVGTAITVGTGPMGIAIAPNGLTAYVANSGSNTVSPINLVTRTAGTAISVGTKPEFVAIDPTGKTAYVTNNGTTTISLINLASGAAAGTITVGSSPAGIAIAPNGQTAYVVNTGPGTVTPVNLVSGLAGTPIPVGTNPVGIAIAPNGQTAYVTSGSSVTPLTLSTGALGTPIPGGAGALGVAITPDGQTALVAANGAAAVTPIALGTGTAGTPIGVGAGPNTIAFAAGVGSSDLSLTQTGPTATVGVGASVTYTLTASNAGPNVSTGTTVTDTLPAGVTLNGATSSQGSCAQGAGSTIACALGGLAVGGSATITIVVTTTASGPITNAAAISGNEGDPAVANNTSSTTTQVSAAASADVSVTVSPSSAPVGLGATETYTITTSNSGPATASNVAVEDDLPAGMAFSSGSSGCALSAGVVACTVGTLAAGASATTTVTAIATAMGPTTDTVEVAAAQADSNTTNNAASSTVTVVKAATTLTRQASASVGFGSAISDSATIAGGVAPTGSVTFALYGPGDNACGTALTTSTATVSGNGTYQSASFTPAAVGTYRWVASYTGDASNTSVAGTCQDANQTVAVGLASQTITFSSTAPSPATVNGASYSVAAGSTSGLPVSLSVDATASSVCSLSGSTVSFVGAGTCTIDASQSGNVDYAPAVQAQQSFNVAGNAQTISLTSPAPANAVVNGQTYNVVATASSGLPVSFVIAPASSSVCTVSGSTVSFIGIGSCLVTAHQNGNSVWLGAPVVQQSFSVSGAAQTISFTSTAPVSATVGGATYAVSATASSGLAVVLTVDASAGSVCSLSAGVVSFLVAGTCTVDANQAGNATLFAAAPQKQQSFTVAAASGGGGGGGGGGGTTTTTTTTTTTPAPTTTTTTTTTTPSASSTPPSGSGSAIGIVKPGSAGSVSVSSGGEKATVHWPSSGLGGGTLTLTVTAVSTDSLSDQGGFAAGTVGLKLAAVDSDGDPVTSFDAPLDLEFPDAPAGVVPAYSQDGKTWVAIPELTSPPALPAGWPDGWYRSSGGTLHILTLHATYFALLTKKSKVEAALTLHVMPLKTIDLSKSHTLALRLATTLASKVTITLTRKGAKPVHWTRTLHPKTTTLRLALPRGAKPGAYTLSVAATAGHQLATTTLAIKLTK